MQLSEMDTGGLAVVEGYGPGFFRVQGQAHEAPLIVTGAGAQPWGGLEDAEGLLALQGDIDVLFVGMGPEIAHLPKGLREDLEAVGLGAEVMSSPSACRTFNVLLGEGRRVAVALLPVG